MRGGGEGGERGTKGGELGVDNLPATGEGFDSEGGEKDDGEDVVDKGEEGLWGRIR